MKESSHFYLDYLKQQLIEPHKACRLVSDIETATIPFVPLMSDGTHIRAFGLDVKFNDHNARLQIDTGASGLVISRSVADHAGLKQFSRMEIGGVGSQGRKSGYILHSPTTSRSARLSFATARSRWLINATWSTTTA